MGAPPLRGFAVVAAPIFSLKKSVACSDLCPTRFSPSGEISALLLAEKSWVRNVCFADVSPPSPQKCRLFRGPQPLRGFAVVAAPIFSLKKSVACSDLCPTRFSPSGEISALLLAEKSWVRNVCFADVSPPSPQKYWQFWVWSLWNIKMDSTPFKKFGFWQCAAFCMKLNNIFVLLFPASTLFSPLFFKLIF